MKTHFKVTMDCLFKFIFGNPKNIKILISLINSVLTDSGFPEIKSAKIENPFNIKEFIDSKESVIDIRAIDESGRTYNIEMQTQSEAHFKNRTLYYWAKLYSGQLLNTQDYEELNPVICINILDFNLFKKSKTPHICFLLKEKDSNLVCTDHLSIHFIELSKVTNDGKYGNLYKWLRYLKFEGTEDKELTDFIESDDEIKNAHDEYEKFLSKEHLQHLYLAREMYQHDEATRISSAEDRGEKKGLTKGKLEEKQNVLIRYLNRKFSLSEEQTAFIKEIPDTEKLNLALDTVLFAETAEEVFLALKKRSAD